MPLSRCSFVLLIYFILHHKIAAQAGLTYPPNSHAHWYFLSPTGYAPPPKTAIFQNGMLGAWQYQKTTNRGDTYTLGLIPTLLFGTNYMPLWVSGHRRIPIGGRLGHPFTIANMGGFFLSLPANEKKVETSDLGLLYLNFTFGNREKNFAIGGAILPISVEPLGNFPQAITLHGMTRLGRRSCLVTENYLIHSGRGHNTWIPCSLSGWRNRTALDVSVLLIRIPEVIRRPNSMTWLPIPWLAVHHTLRYDIFHRPDE